MVIGSFIGVTVGAILGGEAIRQVGATAAISSGLRGATQTFIGLGVVGQAAGSAKKLFKF